ncbi:MAG: hypothetical protein M1819_005417 [Sarea resinae]|nr:MAG: hypothetical protein M1819_005417 [Sarea resinae]
MGLRASDAKEILLAEGFCIGLLDVAVMGPSACAFVRASILPPLRERQRIGLNTACAMERYSLSGLIGEQQLWGHSTIGLEKVTIEEDKYGVTARYVDSEKVQRSLRRADIKREVQAALRRGAERVNAVIRARLLKAMQCAEGGEGHRARGHEGPRREDWPQT